MSHLKWMRHFVAAAVAFLVAVPTFVSAKESDDPNARRRAMEEWYNEAYGKSLSRRPAGGPWSPEFQRHMNEAAARERAKWGPLLPANGARSAPSKDPGAIIQATGSTWVNIGPTKANYLQNGSYTLNKTDTGRVRSVVIDPTNNNTIYVAFSGGGVWKTTDGGATWAPLTETVGSLSTGALAMDPNNPSVLYLGLGDPFDGTGVGLLKSTDGGATWFNPVYLGSSTQIPDLIVAPGDSNIVIAATNAGLFRSVDAGASFSAITLNTGKPAVPYAWSIAWAGGTSFVATLEADPLSTATTTDGQIWRSGDNGATWTRATGVTATGLGRMTVTSAPSSRSTLYALGANFSGNLADIFKSTNGGVSFTALSAGGKRYKNGNTEARNVSALFNTQGWYDQMIAVHPTNPNLVFFGGALHLAKTTDGGAGTYYIVSNWLAQFSLPYVHADIHAAAFDSTGKLFVGTDGGLFVSSDGGATFTDSLNIGIASHLIYQVGASASNRSAVIAGFQDNGTRVRVGTTSTFNQELGGDGFGCDINRTNAANMLGSLYYTRIYKSTDSGLNWASACTGISECNNSSTAPFITRIVAWDGDATGNTVYTYANAKVYKSTNYGSSWSALGTSGLPPSGDLFIRNFGVAKSNANVLGIAANGGRVFLSNNGGASWTQAATLPNNGSFTSDVAFDPTNPNIVYLSSVAPSASLSHLWKSTNFGASWTVIETGLPAGVPVNAIVPDPTLANTLYVATHLGVYESTDGGATWARYGAGLPLVNVMDLQVLPDRSLMRIGTYGRGVWEIVP